MSEAAKNTTGTTDTSGSIDAAATAREVNITAHDLPLHCPQPGAPLWSRHPRVFLDVLKTGEMKCPYCGTLYHFTGEAPKGHH